MFPTNILWVWCHMRVFFWPPPYDLDSLMFQKTTVTVAFVTREIENALVLHNDKVQRKSPNDQQLLALDSLRYISKMHI
jgi:hypothetical protein